MASSPGKWEVVGKDGKARKNTTGNKKNKQKVNEADLPKLDIKGELINFHVFMNVFIRLRVVLLNHDSCIYGTLVLRTIYHVLCICRKSYVDRAVDSLVRL